ncbi:MAG: DNA polymerase/3'-5' exonuclease PolX [bacterium]|nr:DNA polymerase/3'-5' exonuclease PolX [bacterium]
MAKPTNQDIANTFVEIAQRLSLQRANRFRVIAYERAAEVIAALPTACCAIAAEGGLRALRELPGIGEELALKLLELCKRGRLQFLVDLRKEVPRGLTDVLAIEGMGPMKTQFVWKEFDVENIRDLKRLLASGKLEEVPGWGAKSVENLLYAIAMLERSSGRMPIGQALPLAERIVETLRHSALCTEVEIAGSLRRRRETIGDLDILVTTEHPTRVMELFCALPDVRRVIARGTTKANVLLHQGIEADLRVLDPEVFGAGLHYFTGSKAHNIATRKIAIVKGLTISEYGVYRGTKAEKGRRVACRTEVDVFRAIGLPYIPPEIREDSGELSAARARTLPKLIEAEHLRGDLHMHSAFSDGSARMVEMIAAAKRAGYEYVAITDHASTQGIVGGIRTRSAPMASSRRTGGSIAAYVKQVRAAARKVRGIHVLVGAEVDILPDGSLYLSDGELRLLDWVVASLHSSFRQPGAKQTARVVRALAHPAVTCFGHPTGRLIGRRDGVTFDWEAVMGAARQYGVSLEVSASWMRLDLDDIHCRQAHDRGVKVCINSDAHSADALDPRFGIAQARRGWIERSDVINALPWKQFQKRILKRSV